MNTLPPIVKNLIIINVLVFIAQLVLGPFGLTGILALRPIGLGFQPYQLATHMFAHGDFLHILFNMYSLWMFGQMLENMWGPKRFLLFYLICGVGAAALHLLVLYLTGDYAIAVGASGAIMGVFAAFAYLFPNFQLMLFPFPFPVKAKWMVLGLVLLDLFGGIAPSGGSNVAHFAHLGGAITGFIIVLFFNKTDRRNFY
ncbi:rhomboid family intramembrane serine protease [Paraflavisolibacter sp. H34]|uniref:rhomboid family intramembrane serine protease n=1 Tax=Huijunlia imazamoxiresistens TaxID=3127457 RepID=UPI00301AD47B